MTTSMASPSASSARLEDAPLNPLWQPAVNEPGPERKVYVFGESHIRAANGCTLETMLREKQVKIVRYTALGGARYSQLEKMIVSALKAATANTVVAVIAGSNDCRDLAQNRMSANNLTLNDSAMSILNMDTSNSPDGLNTTSSSRTIIKSLKNILNAATHSKAKVIISSPPPSPCYGSCTDRKDPKFNAWCNISPCEHENSYYKKVRNVKSMLLAHTDKVSNQNVVLLDVTTPFLHHPTRTCHDSIVDRNSFRKNNIHFTKAAALKWSKLCLESIMAQFH